VVARAFEAGRRMGHHGGVKPNPSRRLEVSGEIFEITTRREIPGQVDLIWATGPNPGYGFSSRRSRGTHSDEELIWAIKGFLANINPETGYLD
jgi:hypothetical protein